MGLPVAGRVRAGLLVVWSVLAAEYAAVGPWRMGLPVASRVRAALLAVGPRLVVAWRMGLPASRVRMGPLVGSALVVEAWRMGLVVASRVRVGPVVELPGLAGVAVVVGPVWVRLG